MPPEKQEFTIKAECDDPALALEEAREMAGIRAKIDFTVENVNGNIFRVICESDRNFDLGRIIRSANGINLLEKNN